MDVRIQVEVGTISSGDHSHKVPPKLLEFIMLLHERHSKRTDTAEIESWVYQDEVALLPLWSRSSPISIGKEIARYINRLRENDLPIIESEKATQGPWRLSPNCKTRSTDENTVAANLFGITREHRTLLNDYSFYIIIANALEAFDSGDMHEAERLFLDADRHAERPEEISFSLLQRSRILERQKRFAEMDIIRERIQSINLESVFLHSTIKAELHNLNGWAYYRRGHPRKAEKNYHISANALRHSLDCRIFGDVLTARGRLQLEQANFRAALHEYDLALRSWLWARYYYGISQALCNICEAFCLKVEREQAITDTKSLSELQVAVNISKIALSVRDRFAIGYESSAIEYVEGFCNYLIGDQVAALDALYRAARKAISGSFQPEILEVASLYNKILQVHPYKECLLFLKARLSDAEIEQIVSV